jgi:hypothetical protein
MGDPSTILDTLSAETKKTVEQEVQKRVAANHAEFVKFVETTSHPTMPLDTPAVSKLFQKQRT